LTLLAVEYVGNTPGETIHGFPGGFLHLTVPEQLALRLLPGSQEHTQGCTKKASCQQTADVSTIQTYSSFAEISLKPTPQAR
jgi:hypothetical protein